MSADGVQTDPKKLKQLRSSHIYRCEDSMVFLRTCVLLPGFSKEAGPLHALTKKDTPFLINRLTVQDTYLRQLA